MHINPERLEGVKRFRSCLDVLSDKENLSGTTVVSKDHILSLELQQHSFGPPMMTLRVNFLTFYHANHAKIGVGWCSPLKGGGNR